jgi:16S rRNA (cytosine967-C5)-methyltransferase
VSSNPRQAAFSILARIEKEHSYADILLDHELSMDQIKGPDRGLLTELVYGILRRQGTLDHIIRQFSTTHLEKLERSVLLLLRLGLYQLFFLDRVPASAAVNETVKLAHVHSPRAAGFINAVLRQADRKREALVWPDKGSNPVEYISARYSQPEWIVREWLVQLGSTGCEELSRVMSEAPPLTIRVNTLKTTREGLQARLLQEGARAELCKYSHLGMQLSPSGPFSLLPSFREGLFTVQDEASQLVARILAPEPGQKVLDLCAAPGGKTTCLAELMGNRGSILACDSQTRRLEQVAALAGRLGTTIIRTLVLDASAPLKSLKGEQFDRVLVDAPCSGLGVLRRNPEGKWWKSPDDLKTLSELQGKILAHAADAVASGGLLVYATCSTSASENEEVVDNFLSRNNDYMLEDVGVLIPCLATLCSEKGCLRSWPHLHGMDGFFAARLRRRETR